MAKVRVSGKRKAEAKPPAAEVPAPTTVSPKKARAFPNVETPEKVSCKRRLVQTNSMEAKRAVQKTHKSLEADAHGATLQQLFSGIDLVLQLVASRQRDTPFEQLQEAVLAHTRCDLTEERFREVLFVADWILAAYWVGQGESAYLTVEQRDEDGKHTRPQGGELTARKNRFAERLKSVSLPSPPPELPSRPEVPPPRKLLEKPDLPPVQDIDTSLLPPLLPPGQGTPAERFEALRRRVKVKEELYKKAEAHVAQVRQITKNIGICEDAVRALWVLLKMFDSSFVNRASSAPSWRQKSATVPAPFKEKTWKDLIERARIPERKLLSALCSLTWAEQTSNPMTLEAGRAAIAELREMGDGVWFQVQKVPDAGNYLASLGTGSETVRLALKAKIQELEKERRALLTSK
eukprot:CAMPEP_0181469838 /NCGR_PEP_ID=MMETSP1110-20121109/38232_1 /TAXON_ID=174948 /ORGANISM="Symbiodinium sp., Strain CCMP421" /LENGTH=405 /DNA_ID=CAMNT_0023594771 /DNA_START=45 /DNA_END=1262 /DNA_ORIENTATION=+